MSSGGGGGSGRGGGTGAGGVNGGINGRQGSEGVIDQRVLNPNRQRGFSNQHEVTRFETPSLNEMRAKQGALVSRFMTFFQRKCSLVIEMYEASFYRRKPDWDKIAEFIYKDLCGTPDLRQKVLDVQFHPVKMLLFIKCSDEQGRDILVTKVQSVEGVIWSEYGVRVKGYSLDAQVKFIRLMGASPETTEGEIKETFQSLEIGEIIEIKKGVLDAKRLPGVTNGTWALRVKILDPEKIIPSYIHRRDEGELWSLNFEGRVFCCWKCGRGDHIGDKCREQSRTFDEVFNGSMSDEDFVKPSWAAVVRSGRGESAEQIQRIKDFESKLKEENKRKDRERREFEDKERLKRMERENVLREVAENAKQLNRDVTDTDVGEMNDNSFDENLVRLTESSNLDAGSLKNSEVGEAVTESAIDRESVGKGRQVVLQDLNQPAVAGSPLGIVQGVRQDEEHGTLEEQEPPDIHVLQAKERAMKVAFDHKAWLNSRFSFPIVIDVGLGNEISQNQGLLAIKYDGWAEEDELEIDAFENLVTSSPKSQRKRERESVKKSEDSYGEYENNDDHEDSNILFNSSDILIGDGLKLMRRGIWRRKLSLTREWRVLRIFLLSQRGYTREFACTIW